MQATFSPTANTVVAPVSFSSPDRNYRLRLAASRVEAFLAGKRGEVTEVVDRERLAAFEIAPSIGSITVGNLGIGGGVGAKVKPAIVKIVDGRLMLQGIVPTIAGRFRTFDCGQA